MKIVIFRGQFLSWYATYILKYSPKDQINQQIKHPLKMGLEQANILLEKINVLQKSVLADGKISEIERDLMKSYIRNLYEFYLNHTEKTPAAKPIRKVTPAAFETEVIRKKTTSTPVQDNYKPPRVIEIPKEIQTEIKQQPTVVSPIEPEVPVYQAPKATKVEPTAPTNSPKVSKEIKALFKMKKAKELSEKLSIAPIQDLTKAIALNDKLLYSNDLFGSALVTFNEVIRSLNNMPNVVAAENYLMDLAQQYDWPAENRQDTAKAFIKLVRRRFA